MMRKSRSDDEMYWFLASFKSIIYALFTEGQIGGDCYKWDLNDQQLLHWSVFTH